MADHDEQGAGDGARDGARDGALAHPPPAGGLVLSGNLLADLPQRLAAERFDPLVESASVRVERIVSTGQATPAGEWFDQAWDEWVVVIRGAAELVLEPEARPRRLGPGDHLFLPAGIRHRVAWTTPDQPTVWVAVHIKPAPDTG